MTARVRRFARALPVLVLCTGCTGGSARDSGDENVQYDSVYASEQSGVETPLRELVRSTDEWADAWERVAADRRPEVPPAVDFDLYMLIVVGLGTRPSGGYAAQIAAIRANHGTITVTIREVAPGSGCIATMALTAPVLVVRAERVEAEVEFVETRQERDCD